MWNTNTFQQNNKIMQTGYIFSLTTLKSIAGQISLKEPVDLFPIQ